MCILPRSFTPSGTKTAHFISRISTYCNKEYNSIHIEPCEQRPVKKGKEEGRGNVELEVSVVERISGLTCERGDDGMLTPMHSRNPS